MFIRRRNQYHNQKMYTIKINDRAYIDYEPKHINPVEHKLFDGDVYSVSDGKGKVIESPIRAHKNIPGVLQLSTPYGRDGKKRLYKCVPANPRLPIFIIPYENKDVGFSKNVRDTFITFCFVHWKDKFPVGMVMSTIGPVDSLENICKYEIICAGLNHSIRAFSAAAQQAIREPREPTSKDLICPDVADIVYTIDPADCMDNDDAYSICQLPSGDWQITLYIANVALGLDKLAIWDKFSQRISTIYLPTDRIPMIPQFLSENIMSLRAGNPPTPTHFLKFTVDASTGIIGDVEFGAKSVIIRRNWIYDEPELLTDHDYIMLETACRKMWGVRKYVDEIRDSHDVVAYLMLLFNNVAAKHLALQGIGVFRCATATPQIRSSIPVEIRQFVRGWTSSGGKYVAGEASPHELIGLDEYVHITSPLRRLPDLLNQIAIQKDALSAEAMEFYAKWTSKMDEINDTMRKIRRVQNHCDLIYRAKEDKVYKGYNLSEEPLSEESTSDSKYEIYIPELKIVSTVKSEKRLEKYETSDFKVGIFMDEIKKYKRFRVYLVETSSMSTDETETETETFVAT